MSDKKSDDTLDCKYNNNAFYVGNNERSPFQDPPPPPALPAARRERPRRDDVSRLMPFNVCVARGWHWWGRSGPRQEKRRGGGRKTRPGARPRPPTYHQTTLREEDSRPLPPSLPPALKSLPAVGHPGNPLPFRLAPHAACSPGCSSSPLPPLALLYSPPALGLGLALAVHPSTSTASPHPPFKSTKQKQTQLPPLPLPFLLFLSPFSSISLMRLRNNVEAHSH